MVLGPPSIGDKTILVESGVQFPLRGIPDQQEVVIGAVVAIPQDQYFPVGLNGCLNAPVPPVPRTFEDGKTVWRIEGKIEGSLSRCQIPRQAETFRIRQRLDFRFGKPETGSEGSAPVSSLALASSQPWGRWTVSG